MSETLQFIVMVDCDASSDEVAQFLASRFTNGSLRKANSLDIGGNWLEVWANDEYDPTLTSTEDGFLFFKHRAEVTPIKEVSETQQVELAREILSSLEQRGWTAVVCANFENLL